jgi:hypothetical protein
VVIVHKGKTPVLIVPAQGKPYFYRPRDWASDLLVFLEAEANAAEPRLSSERIEYYKRLAGNDNAHRALAAAQLEAAGWV